MPVNELSEPASSSDSGTGSRREPPKGQLCRLRPRPTRTELSPIADHRLDLPEPSSSSVAAPEPSTRPSEWRLESARSSGSRVAASPSWPEATPAPAAPPWWRDPCVAIVGFLVRVAIVVAAIQIIRHG
jgi:hypothetical protein